MSRRGIALAILCLALPLSGLAQASDSARAEVIRSIFAEEAQARVDMPLGGEGVELSDRGEIDKEKLQKQLQKKGKAVPSGRIVRVTKISFSSRSVDIELDGGGKEKKNLSGHVQVTVGGGAPPPASRPSGPKAQGSKVTLKFTDKVPSDLSGLQLKQLLSPVLDFTKRTLTGATVESLPPEFQEAVRAKEALAGMDEDTVLLAMGRPNQRTSEKVNGVEQVTWQYNGRGIKKTFVTFENSIVVKVTEY